MFGIYNRQNVAMLYHGPLLVYGVCCLFSCCISVCIGLLLFYCVCV